MPLKAFDPKKELEAWKKAKPIMLTETGISNVLRNLPAKPTQPQLGEYLKAVKSLETSMEDPKIKKEKKAVACLTTICNNIEKYIADVKDDRKRAIVAMKFLHQAAKDFHAEVTKGPQTLVMVIGWGVSNVQVSRMWDEYVSDAAVPLDVYQKVGQVMFGLSEAARVMKNLMEDAKGGKPRFDTEGGMKKQLAEFKRAMDMLPSACQKLAGLNP